MHFFRWALQGRVYRPLCFWEVKAGRYYQFRPNKAYQVHELLSGLMAEARSVGTGIYHHFHPLRIAPCPDDQKHRSMSPWTVVSHRQTQNISTRNAITGSRPLSDSIHSTIIQVLRSTTQDQDEHGDCLETIKLLSATGGISDKTLLFVLNSST